MSGRSVGRLIDGPLNARAVRTVLVDMRRASLTRLQWLAVMATAAFLVVTAFDVVVNGFLEPSTLMPEHANAGAASPWLPLRATLAFVSAVCGIAALRTARPGAGFQSAFLSLAIGLVLVWSACGIDRSASSYDERAFMAFISDAVCSPGTLTRHDALQRLGRPLLAGTVWGDTECWSYTYMPTAGFGWSKRMLFFDRSGKLVSWDIVDEP